MKVYLGQRPKDPVGGINRVIDSLYTYLPDYDIEITDDLRQADVVHAHVALYQDYPATLPLVVSSHGMMWEEDGWGNIGWKINRLAMDAYHRADVVTAPSEFVAQAIERNTLIYPKVVYHGIDPDEWAPRDSENYVLWNKARTDAACKVDALHELVKRAPGIRFISTYGDEFPNLEVLGQVPYAEMKEIVRAAGVYLITPRESGGPSFGVLEAMVSGVPVLSWNYGGTAEVIRHQETGYLAELDNYDDLTRGLEYCLNNKDRLGKNARNDVELLYNVKETIAGYVEAYYEAIEIASRPAKVSVIVPCFNLGKYLPACVESVKAQTYTDWEMVIVDDASTDGSGEIADSFADDRITVLHNAINLHVSATRNKAIEHSSGKYILPLDADDRLTPDALALMVKTLESDRRHSVVSGKLRLFSEGRLDVGYVGDWPNNTDFELQRTGYNRLPYAAMYRRKVWENVGGYRTRIRSGVEDADFWTRVLSYGYRAKLLTDVTLNYTMRNNSLGKQNKRGTDAWLAWFPWAQDSTLAPLAAEGGPYTTPSYNSPEVTVVVPVGPGHTKHIQTVVDSLIAQSFRNWELIFINDTGKLWNKRIPFAEVIEYAGNRGVAFARNQGIQEAKAPLVVFLDVDDVLQPLALDVLVKAHSLSGGWVYGDWYSCDGRVIKREHSTDWNAEELKKQSFGPITGIYEKEHLLAVGLFDTDAPGWEDWDLHLKLLEQGICGTRVEYPLILYNMHYGWRREDNFTNKKDLIEYIVEKHTNLYRSKVMGCSKCGGKPTLSVSSSSPTAGTSLDMVKMVYTGPQSQTRTIRSKVPGKTHVTYRINNRKPFQVLPGDVEWLLRIKYYEKVAEPKTPEITAPTPESALIADPIVEEPELTPISALDIRPEIASVLEDRFASVEALKQVSDTALLAVKGVGPSRLKGIREAIDKLNA